MSTYKYKDGELIPIGDYHQEQAIAHQQQQIEKFIEPKPADIMPARKPMTAYNPAIMAATEAHTTTEKSTPVERSKAFSIRYASIGIILLFLSLGVVWMAAGTVIPSYVLALFGVMATIAFIALTKYDYENSTYANERHRITKTASLLDSESERIHQENMQAMRLNHELSLTKLEMVK